jgi:hypothetical protein
LVSLLYCFASLSFISISLSAVSLIRRSIFKAANSLYCFRRVSWGPYSCWCPCLCL